MASFPTLGVPNTYAAQTLKGDTASNTLVELFVSTAVPNVVTSVRAVQSIPSGTVLGVFKGVKTSAPPTLPNELVDKVVFINEWNAFVDVSSEEYRDNVSSEQQTNWTRYIGRVDDNVYGLGNVYLRARSDDLLVIARKDILPGQWLLFDYDRAHFVVKLHHEFIRIYAAAANTDQLLDLFLQDNEPLTLPENYTLYAMSEYLHRNNGESRTVGLVIADSDVKSSRVLIGNVITSPLYAYEQDIRTYILLSFSTHFAICYAHGQVFNNDVVYAASLDFYPLPADVFNLNLYKRVDMANIYIEKVDGYERERLLQSMSTYSDVDLSVRETAVLFNAPNKDAKVYKILTGLEQSGRNPRYSFAVKVDNALQAFCIDEAINIQLRIKMIQKAIDVLSDKSTCIFVPDYFAVHAIAENPEVYAKKRCDTIKLLPHYLQITRPSSSSST